VADAQAVAVGAFDRDTAVQLESQDGATRRFSAVVAEGWRAGPGPHGGYLSALLLRALMESVGDPQRSPRSLTIHFLSPPHPGPAQVTTTIEREGRSLSSLSARMEQDGKLVALVLAAFSSPWPGSDISEIEMPSVAPPDPGREPGTLIVQNGPEFARHITLQRRLGGMPFADPSQPMETGGWLGLAEPRPIDALSLAFFCDALIPTPFMRATQPEPAPTVDITIHFRAVTPRSEHPDPEELCLARVRGGLIHEGFFEEDTLIWASDGTLLAQSRQLALMLQLPSQ